MRPTGRALLLLACGLPVAALPTLLGDGAVWWLWLAVLAAFLVLLAAELALIPGKRAVTVDVRAPAVIYFGDDEALQVTASSRRRAQVELRVSCEGDVEPPPPALLDLVRGRDSTAELPLRVRRRGTLLCTDMHLRWTGPLGLLFCEVDRPVNARVQVVPNVRAVRRKVLLMIARREFMIGQRIERLVGEGSEFDSLREFVTGMDRRAIDWKASARHREVLCREFRAERDQQVMLCIDTGRLMAEPLERMPRLDHAIHGALALGYVCIRTGDRVGLFAFAAGVRQHVAPQAGVHALHAIQEGMARLDYASAETNYTLAMTQLLQQLRRRTLVVLFTEFVDSITAELMLPNIARLSRRHLVLFVALRDPLPEQLAERQPRDVEDIHRAVVADEIQRDRLLVLERIRRSGAQVVDAAVGELGPELIARYLQVKRRELV